MKVAVALLGLLLLVIGWTGSVYLPYARPIDQGISLFGAHFNDGINNIALISSLKNSVPPQNPNFSGQSIVGYHYFINLLIAAAEKGFGGDPFVVYFGIVPILLTILLSTFVYFLTSHMVGRFLGTVSVLFSLLLSNYYYFVGTNPSVAWVDEYSTKLVNYQYLSSLVILAVLLILIQRSNKPILIGLLGGLLMGFKVYAWILWILGLTTVGVYELFARKKNYVMIVFCWTITFSLPVYWLFFYGATASGFWLDPLWIIQSMYSSPDRLNNLSWELARQFYVNIKNFLGLAKLYGTGVLVFLLINFGPRLLGLVTSLNNSSINLMKTMAMLGLGGTLLLGQSGSSWNVVQFSYYSVFISSILLALFFKRYPGPVKILPITALMIISLPGSVYTNTMYLHPPYLVKFSSEFVQGLKFLASQPIGVVLVHPLYSSNSIVPAISGKPAYLAEEMILDSYGIDSASRKREVVEFFQNISIPLPQSIKYIFLPSSIKIQKENISNIYNNLEVSIYSRKL